ncbi:MAG: rhomboid family intramembrane serine protease [Butyrivibrio sp.]|nr:rhomboid family intramembrane serine protease [Butyrivibrio sp.]
MPDNIDSTSEDFLKKQQQIYKSAYITIALLIINVVVFLISSLIFPAWYAIGAMYTEGVARDGEVYRIVTATFLHANISHLFNNMIMLGLVGAIIENYIGHGLFLFLYMLAGIVGNLLSMAYEMRTDLVRISVGASGAVMGLVGFLVVWIVINRKELVKDRYMLLRLLFLLIFVVDACFFQNGANTIAHLGGFLTGFVVGVLNIILFKNRKNMEGIA